MRLRKVTVLFKNYDGNKAFGTNNILKTYCKRDCDTTAVNRIIGPDGSHNYMGPVHRTATYRCNDTRDSIVKF